MTNGNIKNVLEFDVEKDGWINLCKTLRFDYRVFRPKGGRKKEWNKYRERRLRVKIII